MYARTNKINWDFDLLVGFLYFSISNISRMLLQFGGIPREITYGLYMIVLALFFLKYYPKFTVIDGVYYLVAIAVVAFGLINYGGYIGSNSRVFAVVFLFLPSFLFFRFFEQEKLYKAFIAAQYYAVFYLFIYYMTTVRFASKYSMDYGYWIALPLITFVFLYFQKKNVFYLMVSLIALVTLTLSGNRGALLLGILCVFYFFVFNEDNKNRGKEWIIRVMLLGVLVLFVIATSNLWLGFLTRFSGSSRTIRKYLEGNLLQSTTRERLYARVRTLIANNKGGYGPMASRMLLVGEPYPHSLIYEFQLDFGIIIGSVASLAIISMGIWNLFYYRNTQMRLIVGYIELMGLGSLMVSSSFYYEIFVPATIALFIISREKARRIGHNDVNYENQKDSSQ